MLFEKLTDCDKNTIESYLNYFGLNNGSSSYRSSAPLSRLMEEWDRAKSEQLYRLFGENFIIEKPVEYSEPVSLLSQKCANANYYGSPINNFTRIYHEWERSTDFPSWSNERYVLNALTNCECLPCESLGQYNYIRSYLPITIDFGNGKKIKLETNTKPIRALGKIVKMFDLDAEVFEAFRLEHSRILNTKKIQGTLCLSIHPLDYMTMSTNADRWTSCMNWTEPGGYRGGTVELMNSPITVVCYLKSDTNQFNWKSGDDGSWNSKKWRLLLTITPTAILSIKAYPYAHEEMSRTAIEWLRDLAKENLNWSFGPVEQVPCCTTFHYPHNNQWYFVDFVEGDAMYCDWGCDTHYGCFNLNPDVIDTKENDPDRLMIDYCGKRVCMCCGTTVYDYYDESYVYCDNCCSNADEDGHYCTCCGEWFDDDDLIWVGDEPYCNCCVDEHAGLCAVDEVYYPFHVLEQVCLAREKDKPNPITDKWRYLHRDYTTRYNLPEEYTNIVLYPRRTEDGVWYLNREDLTARGFSYMFNLWDNDDVEEYYSSPND